MRILIVFSGGDFPYHGSVSRFAYLVARGFHEQGHKVRVIVPRAVRPGPRNQILEGIQVEWCSVPQRDDRTSKTTRLHRMLRWISSRALLIAKTCWYILNSRYEWVLYFFPSIAELPSAGLAHITGKRIMGIFGDVRWIPYGAEVEDRLLQRIGQWVDMTVCRLSSVVFVAGSAILEGQLRCYAPDAVFVRVPPPVDAKKFAAGDRSIFRERLGTNDASLIVYSGSLQPFEGVDDLVECVSQLAVAFPQIRLVVASATNNPAIVSYYLSLIDQYGIKDRAMLLEMLTPSEVVDLLAAADILVIPKKDHPANHAAMPIKLAEYLAAGKPIVASSIGDIPQYLSHREHALLFEPGNVTQMREEIAELLSNKELSEELGRSAQRLADEAFDFHPVISKVIDAMKAV